MKKKNNIGERGEGIRKIHITGGGYSYTVNLPVSVVKGLRWRDNQKVVVRRHGEGILISDWKPKK
ncbi:hypothetical protein KJ885_05290 [Patescibacteria group bacterium]|nr:hypothetical protein [Patescibacteria group bacterium]